VDLYWRGVVFVAEKNERGVVCHVIN